MDWRPDIHPLSETFAQAVRIKHQMMHGD